MGKATAYANALQERGVGKRKKCSSNLTDRGPDSEIRSVAVQDEAGEVIGASPLRIWHSMSKIHENLHLYFP